MNDLNVFIDFAVRWQNPNHAIFIHKFKNTFNRFFGRIAAQNDFKSEIARLWIHRFSGREIFRDGDNMYHITKRIEITDKGKRIHPITQAVWSET